MHTVTFDIGDEVLLNLNLSPSEFTTEARLLLAAKLYELGRVTSGVAAKLAGMGRAEFLLSLARVGVSTSNLRAEDADEEIAFAHHA